MKVRRDIAALPIRSGDDTWDAIAQLIVAKNSNDRGQIAAARPVMGTLLSEDFYSSAPLTVTGDSHRLVIYCAYGEDALTIDAEVEPLGWNPTEGEWKLFVPCAPEYKDWATRKLASVAPRFTVIDLHEHPTEDDARSAVPAPLVIDWNAQ